MDKRRLARLGTQMTILELEHSLGFKWKATLANTRAAEAIPCIEQLRDSLAQLIAANTHTSAARIENCPDTQAKLKKCFNDLGPMIWPDHNGGAWLVGAASENWGGLYRRNLHFSDVDERKTLWSIFRLYATAKIIVGQRRRPNRGGMKKRAAAAEPARSASTYATSESTSEKNGRRRKAVATKTRETSPQPLAREPSPMRTRWGKPFGYGLDLAELTPRVLAKPASQQEAGISVKDSQTLPSNRPLDIHRETGSKGSRNVRLLVDYGRAEIQTICLRECSDNSSLFDVIDRQMPWEVREGGNVVEALRVVLPGTDPLVLHPEGEMGDSFRVLSSCDLSRNADLEAIVEYAQSA